VLELLRALFGAAVICFVAFLVVSGPVLLILAGLLLPLLAPLLVAAFIVAGLVARVTK
jgi:hypothetical protein